MSKTLDVMTQNNWSHGGVAGYARYEFSDDFVDEDGREFEAGPKSYLEVATTISGSVVTVPAYPNFPTTESAILNNGVTVTCYLLDSNRIKRTTLFEECRIYTSLPSVISLSQLVLANGASRLLRDDDVWTKEQVIDYFNAHPAAKMTVLAYGMGRLSVAASDPADPKVAGDNDPRIVNVANLPINVSTRATAGLGTLASPWTGWDTAITWSEYTAYYFPTGYYAFATWPNTAKAGIKLFGDGVATVLKHTGTGNAVSFVGTLQGSGASGPSDITFAGFKIQGNPLTVRGLYIECCHRSNFDAVVSDCTTAAFELHFTVLNTYRFKHSYFGTTIPTNGLVTNQRNAGEHVQACTFINPIMEGCGGDGIVLNNTWLCQFIGGSSEGHTGDGLLENSTCVGNTFDGMDNEANAGGDDFTIQGNGTLLKNVISTDRVTIGASSKFVIIDGGAGQNWDFVNGAQTPTVRGYPAYNILGTTGAITYHENVDIDALTPFRVYASGAVGTKGPIFPTLSSSWSSADPYILYRKCAGRTVIEGRTSGGTIPTDQANAPVTLFTLKAPYRPVRDHRFAVSAGSTSAVCHIEVLTTGVVRLLVGNDASAFIALYLDGIEFDAYF